MKIYDSKLGKERNLIDVIVCARVSAEKEDNIYGQNFFDTYCLDSLDLETIISFIKQKHGLLHYQYGLYYGLAHFSCDRSVDIILDNNRYKITGDLTKIMKVSNRGWNEILDPPLRVKYYMDKDKNILSIEEV